MLRCPRNCWTRILLMALVTMPSAGFVRAAPPAGDPNQPYDKLPGTHETYHVKWAKPLEGGPLKVLFIVPFSNSREVVELAQRLDVEYTVIMNVGRSVWKDGNFSDSHSPGTPLHGSDADVLDSIAASRLSLGNDYDAIVIGKISWEVLPDSVRTQILNHVAGGTGLPTFMIQVDYLTWAFLGDGPPPGPPFPDCGVGGLETDEVLGCQTPPEFCK